MTEPELIALAKTLPFPRHHVREVMEAFAGDEALGIHVLRLAATMGWSGVPGAWLRVLPGRNAGAEPAPRARES